jgi:N-acetyl-1-D-myo-inositol-2-amino-2-deoxy-alpha-D-glucopyranoside deacetylase
VPRSTLEAGIEQFADSSHNPFGNVKSADELPFGTPDEDITACVDAREHAEEKVAAVRAHATQIPANYWMLAVASNFGAEFMGIEFYQLAAGSRGPADGPNKWESDLFAGLDLPAGLASAR